MTRKNAEEDIIYLVDSISEIQNQIESLDGRIDLKLRSMVNQIEVLVRGVEDRCTTRCTQLELPLSPMMYALLSFACAIVYIEFIICLIALTK